MEVLDITCTDKEIEATKKNQWKKFFHERVKDTAYTCLIEDNSHKSKTKHIIFETLKMSDYLIENENTSCIN